MPIATLQTTMTFVASNPPDPQKDGLFTRRRALGDLLEGVDVRYGVDCGCHVPRQAKKRVNGHQQSHHQQVQVITATFLHTTRHSWRHNVVIVSLPHTHRHRHTRTHTRARALMHTVARTTSLCSARLTMTAVMCWSMKIKMVASRAGNPAAMYSHQGFVSEMGLINQPRASYLVGCQPHINKHHT